MAKLYGGAALEIGSAAIPFGGAGRPAAPQGLHPGVKPAFRKNALGIILAAAAALLCTAIDQLLKEES